MANLYPRSKSGEGHISSSILRQGERQCNSLREQGFKDLYFGRPRALVQTGKTVSHLFKSSLEDWHYLIVLALGLVTLINFVANSSEGIPSLQPCSRLVLTVAAILSHAGRFFPGHNGVEPDCLPRNKADRKQIGFAIGRD